MAAPDCGRKRRSTGSRNPGAPRHRRNQGANQKRPARAGVSSTGLLAGISTRSLEGLGERRYGRTGLSNVPSLPWLSRRPSCDGREVCCRDCCHGWDWTVGEVNPTTPQAARVPFDVNVTVCSSRVRSRSLAPPKPSSTAPRRRGATYAATANVGAATRERLYASVRRRIRPHCTSASAPASA